MPIVDRTITTHVHRRTPSNFAFLVGTALIWVAVAWTHAPSLDSRVVMFDDNEYLHQNPLVLQPSWRSVGTFLAEILEPSTVGGYYQPLAMISLMLDVAMGASPEYLRPFHRTSLILHVANTSLIMVFIYLLFGSSFAATTAGLLFGLHPLTVETIPWVADRKTLLSTLFSLSSLICYTLYVRRSRSILWYAACLVLSAAALLSKPTSTMLPVVFLLLDIWPLGPNGRSKRRILIEKVPFLALAALSAAITVESQRRTASIVLPGQHELGTIPLILSHNIIFYFSKILWPVNLSAFYTFPRPFNLSNPRILGSAFGAVAMAVFSILAWRRSRSWTLGLLIWLTLILPTLGIIGFANAIAADRYTYLPAIGLLLPLAFLASRCWVSFAKRRLVRTALVAGILLIAAAEARATRHQYRHWTDTETLFRHMLANAPDSPLAHRGLGNCLKAKGCTDEAIQEFRRTLELNERDAIAHSNLAVLLAMKGDTEAAISHCRRAVKLKPKWATGHNNLANALAQAGRRTEAFESYRRALELRPDYADAHNNIGMLHAEAKNWELAISHYREAIRLRPSSANAHHNWGEALVQQNKPEEAAEHYREALRLNPASAETRRMLEELNQ